MRCIPVCVDDERSCTTSRNESEALQSLSAIRQGGRAGPAFHLSDTSGWCRPEACLPVIDRQSPPNRENPPNRHSLTEPASKSETLSTKGKGLCKLQRRIWIERLSLRVEPLEGEPGGTIARVCIAESDSRLIPELKSGELRLVHRYELLQFDPAVEPLATK